MVSEQSQIRRFLLGKLTGQERENFEEAIIADSNLIEEVLICEDELIDDYLMGELSAADAALFESFFLSFQQNRRKLALAELFLKHIGCLNPPTATQANPQISSQKARRKFSDGWFLRPQAIIAVGFLIVLVCAGVWLLFNQTKNNSALENEVIALNRMPTPKNFLNIALMSGITRSANSFNIFKLESATEVVRLQLAIPDADFISYSAKLAKNDREELFAIDDLQSQSSEYGKEVLIFLPAASLPPGNYRLNLEGKTAEGKPEKVGTYLFSIQK